jgi:hypothetical protein
MAVFMKSSSFWDIASCRFWRVLMMEYNTQDYWVFGLCPSSGILDTRKHDVSETGSVPVLRWRRGEDTYSVGPLHLRTETDPVSEKSCFLVSRIPDDRKVQKKTVITPYSPLKIDRRFGVTCRLQDTEIPRKWPVIWPQNSNMRP